ncbi:MAG: LysR family transcriptional regulator [Prosthecobacter sp.]
MSDPSRQYFKELRLQQFRSIVALARWGTFTGAAAALKLTRASVWQQVHGLEQEMACALVRSKGQRVELTAAGHKLVELVAPLVAGLDSVKDALLASIRDDLPQSLVIATPPSFLVHELREPITRIHEQHPRLQLTLLERTSAAAVELVEQGGADVAIAARLEDTPRSKALEYTPFTRYRFTFICPENHPLRHVKKLTLEHFTQHPLILPGQTAYCRQRFDSVISQAGLQDKVHIVIESTFPFLLFEYVRMGMGIALSPLPAQMDPSPQHAGVILRDVSHLFGEEEICHVRRKGEFELPCATAFREMVTQKRRK